MRRPGRLERGVNQEGQADQSDEPSNPDGHAVRFAIAGQPDQQAEPRADAEQQDADETEFGATMSAEGEVHLAAAATDSDQPASQDVIDLLAAGMRQQAQAGAIRAAGICYDSRFALEGAAPSDAIAVSLEHRDGDAVLVMQPYSKGRFSGFKFGDLVAVPPERRVLAPDH